jgi:DNA repair photolyase
VARPEAPEVLARELARKGYVPATIAIGTNTDPYQPIEKDWRIMRRLLEVLRDHRHPVTVVTKGTLIERDADILGEMGRMGLARVSASRSRRSTPRRAPDGAARAAPARRIETIRRLTEAGCPVRVMASP